MEQVEVLIAGAGPTGLVLGLYLTQLGVQVRIIDAAPHAGSTSRALAVQARTLELYRLIGLADAVVQRSHRTPALNLWVSGQQRAHIAFSDIGAHLSPYPFMLIYPQDEHEQLLESALRERGVSVERSTELVLFQQQGEGVLATLRHADGSEHTCAATYLAGCDGARSRVREGLGTGFPGGTYSQLFYVADVVASGPPLNGELHVDLDEADFLAVFPLPAAERVRLIGIVRGERAQQAELSFNDVGARVIDQMQLQVKSINWFSTYRVHHRVTDHFRVGRAFLLGDAAHIHSPVGGQGMNTGIGDAFNLGWKLAAVLRGDATDALLETFEPERMAFARRLVSTTDRLFTLASSDGSVAEVVRTRVVPVLLPKIIGFERAREFLFRTVGQLALNYRECAFNEGAEAQVHGGDRLPWVAAAAGAADNYASLEHGGWQLHVYGAPTEELRQFSQHNAMALQVFEWTDAHANAGLARDAVYLLRPDGYVGLAATPAAVAPTLERYFHSRSLRPGPWFGR